MEIELSRRRAVVSGSSQGIGLAIATELARAGAAVVVTPVEMVHYGMTKTALLAVTRGYAKAAAGTGVTINSVMAGPTHAPGVEDFVHELVGDELPWD